MKVIDQKLVTKVINEVKGSRHYSAGFKRKVLTNAVHSTANHAARLSGVSAKRVRQWLRLAGLDSAINGYYWK